MSMRTISPRILGLPLLFLFMAGLGLRAEETAQTEKCFCWRAESGTATVYLLGSIHVGKEDFYPLPKVIEDGFESSKFLVVEADITKTDEAAMATQMMTKGKYQGADTLSTKLTAGTLEKLKKYCETSGLPLANLEKLKPWVLVLTLTMMEMQKLDFKPELGIDMHFLKQAKERKPVKELESIQFQIDLLSGLDDNFQDKLLLSSLSELGSMKEDAEKMVAAWKKGDADSLKDLPAKSTKQFPELKDFMVKFVDDRNVAMAEKIDGYLKGNEPHFVVVGALHLVGDMGLIRLLEKKGYKVQQLARTPAPVPENAIGK